MWFFIQKTSTSTTTTVKLYNTQNDNHDVSMSSEANVERYIVSAQTRLSVLHKKKSNETKLGVLAQRVPLGYSTGKINYESLARFDGLRW